MTMDVMESDYRVTRDGMKTPAVAEINPWKNAENKDEG
jgi:hypothetical protein